MEQSNPQAAATAWLHEARRGVFMHFLAPRAQAPGGDMSGDEWNRRVDAFDVEGLAGQLSQVGARYFFITIGQNTGHFCSPNATYDSIVQRRPSRLSRRDLVADLHRALAPRGIRLGVYLPSHAPAFDPQAINALRCTPAWDVADWEPLGDAYTPEQAAGTDERLTDFQHYWEAIIREWSLRWAGAVSAWWFDGCYFADHMYRNEDEPNFASFAAAVKAGNGLSLVAFNGGVKVPVISMTPYEDFTAGEIANAWPLNHGYRPMGRFVGTAQYHVLSFLGQKWAEGSMRFTDAMAQELTRHINSFGGAVTWDVPFNPDGTLGDDVMRQLAAIGEENYRPKTADRRP